MGSHAAPPRWVVRTNHLDYVIDWQPGQLITDLTTKPVRFISFPIEGGKMVTLAVAHIIAIEEL